MKRMGVLGGMSAQATIDFEVRVHRSSQRLVGQDWNRGYPRMVVWYHRDLPVRRGHDGHMLEPRQIDPQLVEAAARLAPLVDFLVIRVLERYGLIRMTDATGSGKRRVRVPRSLFDQIELKIAI